MIEMGMSQMLRKPDWIRVKVNLTDDFRFIDNLLSKKRLNTVCEEARCPNMHECWGTHRTATFMILGDTCTRRCRFCSVKTGLPDAVDWDEPNRVAESVAQMKLAKEDLEIKVYTLPKELDEEVARLHLKNLSVTLTQMTQEQSDYIGIPVNGPFKAENYKY